MSKEESEVESDSDFNVDAPESDDEMNNFNNEFFSVSKKGGDKSKNVDDSEKELSKLGSKLVNGQIGDGEIVEKVNSMTKTQGAPARVERDNTPVQVPTGFTESYMKLQRENEERLAMEKNNEIGTQPFMFQQPKQQVLTQPVPQYIAAQQNKVIVSGETNVRKRSKKLYLTEPEIGDYETLMSIKRELLDEYYKYLMSPSVSKKDKEGIRDDLEITSQLGDLQNAVSIIRYKRSLLSWNNFCFMSLELITYGFEELSKLVNVPSFSLDGWCQSIKTSNLTAQLTAPIEQLYYEWENASALVSSPLTQIITTLIFNMLQYGKLNGSKINATALVKEPDETNVVLSDEEDDEEIKED